MRTISIDIEIDGDDEVAMAAIDAALDAGAIQEAIFGGVDPDREDEDGAAPFDIESATSNYRDAHVIAYLRKLADAASNMTDAGLLRAADAIEHGEHLKP